MALPCGPASCPLAGSIGSSAFQMQGGVCSNASNSLYCDWSELQSLVPVCPCDPLSCLLPSVAAGVLPGPPSPSPPPDADTICYLQRYADLQATFCPTVPSCNATQLANARCHYVEWGVREARTFNCEPTNSGGRRLFQQRPTSAVASSRMTPQAQVGRWWRNWRRRRAASDRRNAASDRRNAARRLDHSSGSPSSCGLHRAVLSMFSTSSRSFACVNDDNTTDSMGRTCSEIENDGNINFDTRRYCQGDYDDLDFRASVQCCPCDPAGIHSFLYSNSELVNQFRTGPGPEFASTFGASLGELHGDATTVPEMMSLKYRLGSDPSTSQLASHDPADWRFTRGLLAAALPMGCTRAPRSVGRPSKASAFAEIEASGKWVTWRGLDVIFSTSANRTMLMVTATAATRASDRHKIKGRVLVDGKLLCRQVRIAMLLP